MGVFQIFWVYYGIQGCCYQVKGEKTETQKPNMHRDRINTHLGTYGDGPRCPARRPSRATIEAILKDPQFSHVYFDISWDEVAKYLLATSESIRISAQLINRYPDRLLFGTDEVAPPSQEKYLKVYQQYQPLWDRLDKETSEEVRKGNYEHIFDVGGKKVRAWEQVHVKP